MSQLITATATRPPALREREDTDQIDHRASAAGPGSGP